MNWQVLVQQLWNGLLNGSIYVLFASGLTLVFGVMRVINMAHGEVAMLGAMGAFAFMSFLDIPLVLAALLALAFVAVFSILLERIAILPYIDSDPLTVLLTTLAVSLVLLHGTTTWLGSQPRSLRLSFDRIIEVGGIFITLRGVLIIITAALAMAVLYWILYRTSTGKMWRATAQNTLGAQLIGIDTQKVFRQTIMAASVLAALSGLLLGVLNSARPDMGQSLLITGFAVVIVAGMGSIAGTVVVGLGIGLSEALFAQYISTDFRQAFVYAVMILVLLLRPQGLFGER